MEFESVQDGLIIALTHIIGNVGTATATYPAQLNQ